MKRVIYKCLLPSTCETIQFLEHERLTFGHKFDNMIKACTFKQRDCLDSRYIVLAVMVASFSKTFFWVIADNSSKVIILLMEIASPLILPSMMRMPMVAIERLLWQGQILDLIW